MKRDLAIATDLWFSFWQVRGYPTLFLFKDGKREEKYSKGRDLESLKSYLTGQFKKDEL